MCDLVEMELKFTVIGVGPVAATDLAKTHTCSSGCVVETFRRTQAECLRVDGYL